MSNAKTIDKNASSGSARVNFKSVWMLAKFNLKVAKRKIVGWSIAIFAVMFLYMILFPSVKDMAQVKWDMMPEEMMKFVGMEDLTVLDTFTGYFTMIYNLVLVAISIFAITFAAGVLQSEEKEKTIEFLYSLEVNRTEIYISKLCCSFIAVFAVVMAAGVSACVCGLINGGETFDFMEIKQVMTVGFMSLLLFMAVGGLLGGLSGKTSAGSIGGIVVVFSYMLGFLSEIVPENLQWFQYFSPFILFSGENALAMSSETMVCLAVAAALSAAMMAVGGVVYCKRDF